MHGIKSNTANFIATTTIALGVAAVGVMAITTPATADGGSYGRSYEYGNDYRGGHRHGDDRGYWKRHGHHGVTVYAWKPVGHRPSYQHRRIQAACHPVVGLGTDHFGRQAKFGGTMCYDRFGNGYVVTGSRHVIHYY